MTVNRLDTKNQHHQKLIHTGKLLVEIIQEMNKRSIKSFCPCCGRTLNETNSSSPKLLGENKT
jgi:hypothetical protein